MPYVPAVNTRQLDAIDYNQNGELILGASSLTNRYWTGSIWYFKDPSLAPDPAECTTGVETDTGISVLQWFSEDRIVAGGDSGALMLWALDETRQTLTCETQPVEHDDIVTSVSVSSDKEKLVSSSQSTRIKVWDATEFVSVASYNGHFDAVLCVACHPTNANMFASGSKDNRLILWDIRQAKPASLMETQFLPSHPTSLAWHPDKEHTLVVGTETGHVVQQDRRWSVGTPIVVAAHTRSVQQMAFAAHRSTWLGTVSHDCTATVIDFSTEAAKKVIYRDTGHTDFVRSLAWHPRSHQLSTCGWDYKVLRRDVHEAETLSSPLATMQLNGETTASGAAVAVMDTVASPEETRKQGGPVKSSEVKAACNGHGEEKADEMVTGTPS